MRWLFTIFFTFYGILITMDIIGVLKPWEWGLPHSNWLNFGVAAVVVLPLVFYFWHLLDSDEPEEGKSS